MIKKISISFIIAFCAMGLQLVAQDAFTSSRLNELFALIPLECKNSLGKENKCNCTLAGTVVPVKATFNSKGQLNHLGIDLFNFDAKLIYPDAVLSFVERTFLEYLVWNNVAFINQKNREDKLILKINDKLFGTPGGERITAVIPVLLNDSAEISIKKDSLFYEANFKTKKGSVNLVFAANYQVVSGMDKQEYAVQLMNSLKSYSSNDTLKNYAETKNLKQYKDSLKVKIGNSYFRIISSNTYFHCANQSCKPVFSEKYPSESFCNSFLLPLKENKDVILKIDQKMYGNRKEIYEVKLIDFIRYFSPDHELFFGIENNSDSLMDGTLIVYNRSLNFINILYVNTTPKNFFEKGKRVINTKFYTNVPIDNIKNLFAETDSNNK
jgi:hypothetical protein